MNNHIHLQRIQSLTSVREKLEYCVDNKITSDNCSPEILEILEDLKDQVETDLEFNMQAVLSFEHGMQVHEEPAIVYGNDRRPLPAREDWSIDELGNVFTSQGELAHTEFILRWGGLYIRPNQPGPRVMVAQQVLLAFGGPSPDGQRYVLYRDSDMTNVAYDNLRWIHGNPADSNNRPEGDDNDG